jgi:pimeloyl-ACP methyl ester carboxylesterase
MVRVWFALLLLATAFQFACPIAEFTIIYRNIRCAFADSLLKKPMQVYDELVSPWIISYHYYSKDKEPQKIGWKNGSYYLESFDPSKPTRLVIHGFWNSQFSSINKALREIYLDNFDVNLIIVNYSKISRDTCYKIARNRIGILGRRIAEFLDLMLGDDEWQWNNLFVIGHSLGAHTSGVVGRTVKKGRIGAIFGLDPAGPGFSHTGAKFRLRRGDADYVECIHTNGDSLGLLEPYCTVDIYPNFGSNQPGCNILLDLCSHSRAWKYFAESLTSNFTSYECTSMQQIKNEIACNGTELVMGENSFETKGNATGIFYLTTNEESPFSQG